MSIRVAALAAPPADSISPERRAAARRYAGSDTTRVSLAARLFTVTKRGDTISPTPSHLRRAAVPGCSNAIGSATIAVMSAAIATQIDTDPGAAKAAVADVRRQSTAVLRDLRNLVGLLRDHDDPAAADGVRAETLAGISDLVGSVVAAGQHVVLTVVESPERRPLGSGVGPLAQLAAYRMVQEALANAGRHAPGSRCDVEVDDRGSEALVVTVRNAPGPPVRDPAVRGGLGLVGMRERAELTGSTVEAGATPDGGWLVRLRTPRSEPEGGS